MKWSLTFQPEGLKGADTSVWDLIMTYISSNKGRDLYLTELLRVSGFY